jgi:carbonic anhydrase
MNEKKRVAALVVGTVMVGGAMLGFAKTGPDAHDDPRAKPPAPAKAPLPTRFTPSAPAPTPAPKPAPVVSKTPAPAARPTTSPAKTQTPASAASTTEGDVSSDEALQMLMDGNARWVSGTSQNPNVDPSRRQDLSDKGQKPFAIVYTCADSRLPVERVFDRGVGDVFVSRIAGNVIAEHEAGTIEYAVEHLHAPLLVVMGHTNCGAVKAALAGGSVTPNIDTLLNEIKPAVDRARNQNPDANDEQLLSAAIRENVWQGVYDLLKSSSVVREHVAQGKVKVVGAVCDIATGKVTFMGEHPWQTQLVDAFTQSERKEAAHPDADDNH